MYHLIPNSDFEIYVDPDTNELGTSLCGASRILEVPEQTLRDNLSLPRFSSTKPAEIQTSKGFRLARIVSANDLFFLSIKYNPKLCARDLDYSKRAGLVARVY